MKQLWIPDALRSAGLAVVEEPGWQDRGHGDMGTVRGVLLHHTAGPLQGDAPSLDVVRDGRPDLKGPLAQLLLARSGVFHMISAGLCWHAGAGAWQGITKGNSEMIGIEAENTGLLNDPWPSAQINACLTGCAVLLKHIGAAPIMCAGHKEYALPPGRKVDPRFNMIGFRSKLALYML